MIFSGICYRALEPRWSVEPLSGAGAALSGGRFNLAGMPALYLSDHFATALFERSQGLAKLLKPVLLVTYQIDCADIYDLTDPVVRQNFGIDLKMDMDVPWREDLARGRHPRSWSLTEKLYQQGVAGIFVPSFAPGNRQSGKNLVLWRWGEKSPHRVRIYDPDRFLPRNPLSWQ